MAVSQRGPFACCSFFFFFSLTVLVGGEARVLDSRYGFSATRQAVTLLIYISPRVWAIRAITTGFLLWDLCFWAFSVKIAFNVLTNLRFRRLVIRKFKLHYPIFLSNSPKKCRALSFNVDLLLFKIFDAGFSNYSEILFHRDVWFVLFRFNNVIQVFTRDFVVCELNLRYLLLCSIDRSGGTEKLQSLNNSSMADRSVPYYSAPTTALLFIPLQIQKALPTTDT